MKSLETSSRDSPPSPIPMGAPGKRGGRLKVFLGMSAGVGKTRAMMEAAQGEQIAGRDVLIGYLARQGEGGEPTNFLASIPFAAPVDPPRAGQAANELDLDAVLARRPGLVVVDVLAHANPAGSRHPKRYQDVQELLDAGIDVFTTLNVQNVESLAEAARQITGVAVKETVPDTLLEKAEFELIDLPARELKARLAADPKYAREGAWAAQQSIFRPGSLSAMRELALRFVAEQVSREVLSSRRAGGEGAPWKSGHRLAVGVNSNPAAAQVIRWTRRLAGELHATWLAVHVDTGRSLDRDGQSALARNLALARELGAQIVTTTDDDVTRGLLRVAREQNAAQIVVGKTEGWRARDLFRGGTLLSRLARQSGDIDVHAVRAGGRSSSLRRPAKTLIQPPLLRQYVLAIAMVGGMTLLNWELQRWLGYQPLGLIYLVGIAVLALFVSRGPVIAAAALTTLAWDYFFEPPAFSFRFDNLADEITTVTYFAVALIIGRQTSRLREKEASERRREQHATGLYMLTRALAGASHEAGILSVVVAEVGNVSRTQVALSLPGPSPEDALTPFSGGTWNLSEKEQEVAGWALRNRQAAGPGTGTSASAEGLHLPLVAGDRALGVLSLRLPEDLRITADQKDLLDGFVRQIALSLDRERLREAEQRAKVVAESERFSKTLLNSVSHEIRTPIAAIMSAASALSGTSDASASPFQRQMGNEIQEAAQRLNRLVGNLLNMTRLETGHVKPKLDWCDVKDLVYATLDDIEPDLASHRVNVEVAPGLPPFRMDFALMQQVLTNLLLNAVSHTPPGTAIHLSAASEDGILVMTVADNGSGLPAEALAHVFDKFYRAPSARPGGTGLGLAIVKGFMEAQGGRVNAQNRPDGGAAFTVRLPPPNRTS